MKDAYELLGIKSDKEKLLIIKEVFDKNLKKLIVTLMIAVIYFGLIYPFLI